MKKATPIFLAFLLSSCVSVGTIDGKLQTKIQVLEQRNEQRLSSVTLESLSTCTSVEEDESTDVLTFSSYNCQKPVKSPYPRYYLHLENDFYIRAVKTEGAEQTVYVVYAMLYGNNWSDPYSASYLHPQEDGEPKLVRVDTKRISREVSCPMAWCTHEEHYTFPLDQSYLKALSDGYDELSQTDWRQKMRILTKAHKDFDFAFHINELVGFYRMVEAHQVQTESEAQSTK